MMTFSLWKQIKKKLRRQRKIVWTLGGIAFLILLSAAVVQTPVYAAAPLEVTLHRQYVCGEEMEQLGRMTAGQIVDLLKEHPNWNVNQNGENGMVVLVEQIDDLSDYCKSHAYFGIDRNGNLSLFDGEPRDDKVLRTFFQLDIQYMESSLPRDQLDRIESGIRVNDIDEYNSILSTYSDFALENDERVMKQDY